MRGHHLDVRYACRRHCDVWTSRESIRAEDPAELVDLKRREPLIVKAEVKRPLRRHFRAPLFQQLAQERRLARAAHPAEVSFCQGHILAHQALW